MKRILFCLLFSLHVAIGFSQTLLSGVINIYTKVTTIDTCRNLLVVQNASAYKKGERVLLIQMKGASIAEGNTAAFGNVFAYRGAGNYEVNVIDSIFANNIILKNKFINNYNTAYYVQLLNVPKYSDATVIDTLRAQKWNGATGGILALEADKLTLNAPIDASAKGFRGGRAQTGNDATNTCSWLFSVADYFLPKNNWRGAEKGEGIADYIAGKEWGRGALATGGGGGNDHNTGGGGGANISKGGLGGKNDEKSTFSCQGPNAGLGGKGVGVLDATNHYFLGSGGGAGHGNNGQATDGGTGGGMIFLFGKNMISNNNFIKANGENVKNNNGDGGGGGGAGGTIILDFEEIQGSVKVEVKGGKGGTIDNKGEKRCFGPGGGGAGGRIVYTSPLVVTGDFSGGGNGLSTNGLCQDAANGAEKGEAGFDELFPYINIAKDLFETPLIALQPKNDTVCIGSNVTLKTLTKAQGFDYQWQVSANGANFSNINASAKYQGQNTEDLTILNVDKTTQNNQYQCVITNDCGIKLVTNKVQIYLDSVPKIDFSITLVGTQIICTNKSTGGTSYAWDFGDGDGSNFKNPTHLYTNDGDFTVELAVTNRCGTVFLSQLITIVTRPLAAFDADTKIGCAPLTVNFENKSSPNVKDYKWTFAGASLKTSTDKNPSVTYLKSGIYGVTLEVANSKFRDTARFSTFITLTEKPTADFSFTAAQDAKINFKNLTSNNATSYRWEFGDATFSIDKDPSHDFVKDGDYTVTLTVTNACGEAKIIKTVKVETFPRAAFSINANKGCVPFTAKMTNSSSANASQYIWRFPGAEKDTSSQRNPSVTYTKSGTYDIFLTVKNSKGKDSIAKKAILILEDKPIVNFDVTTNLLQADFVNKSQNYTALKWNFGESNNSSILEKPSFTYSKNGKFKVTLAATNTCGTAQLTKEIEVINKLDCDDITLELSPNPSDGYTILKFNAGRYAKMPYILCAADGRVVQRGDLDENKNFFEFDLSNLASGVYVLYLKCEKRVMTQKILKLAN